MTPEERKAQHAQQARAIYVRTSMVPHIPAILQRLGYPEQPDAEDFRRTGRVYFAAQTKTPVLGTPEHQKYQQSQNAFAEEQAEILTAFIEAREEFVASVLTRLEKGIGLDPESNDPSGDWQPCGMADAVYYIGELSRAVTNPATGQLIRDVIEAGYECQALSYIKPPSDAWLQRMKRRQDGQWRGLHVPKHAGVLCPDELQEQADRQERIVEWYFAVEVPNDKLDAGMNPMAFKDAWHWFEVEEGVWAGLFVR